MSENRCSHCKKTFANRYNLNIHLKDRCSVLKASTAMSELRISRSEIREENGGSKKRSKSPRQYDDEEEYAEEASQFERDSANDVFQRLCDGEIADFKAFYNLQVPVVQSLLMDKISKERLSYIRKKREFEIVHNRYMTIENGFTQLTAVAVPTVAITNTTNTTAATSNSAGGIFGGMFNSQNFNTTSNANV